MSEKHDLEVEVDEHGVPVKAWSAYDLTKHAQMIEACILRPWLDKRLGDRIEARTDGKPRVVLVVQLRGRRPLRITIEEGL